MTIHRGIGVAAGLAGAFGVATLAVGSHAVTGANLDIAGQILLMHAAALVGLSLAGSLRGRGLAALLIIVGCLLFSGDLVFRAATERHLFPMAAPSGGIALILGWLTVAIGAIASRER